MPTREPERCGDVGYLVFQAVGSRVETAALALGRQLGLHLEANAGPTAAHAVLCAHAQHLRAVWAKP